MDMGVRVHRKNKLRERGLLIEDKPTDAKKEKSKSVAQSAANVNSFSHQYTQTRSAENLSAEERELIIRTTLENVNAPEFVIGVANTIDTLFDIRYDDAGIKMMRDLENYILRLENIEEFVQYVPAYSCVCGLMFSLGYLTKEESDQMSRSFTLRVQDKAIEFASMKPEALS